MDECKSHIIGKGGATISRLARETGARINMEKGSGECIVSGSAAAVAAGAHTRPFLTSN